MADYNIKARPTTYKGIPMRSRLEAQAAARLDARGMKWEYEPQCFADETGQYLPDFYVHGWGYIEVKPTRAHAAEALERMHIILGSVPEAQLLVFVPDGNGGFVSAAWCFPHLTDETDGGWLVPKGTCRCLRKREPASFAGAIADGDHMHCVKCGGAYTHLADVDTYRGGSDDIRYTARLHFWCEYGCTFSIEVYNHKGYTKLNVGEAKDGIIDFDVQADDDAT